MKKLENLVGPIIYSTIDEHAWNEALKMVMSKVPPPAFYETSSFDTACDEFMQSDNQRDWPEDFLIWQPYENYSLGDAQELVENFRDSLISFARITLIDAGVITDE